VQIYRLQSNVLNEVPKVSNGRARFMWNGFTSTSATFILLRLMLLLLLLWFSTLWTTVCLAGCSFILFTRCIVLLLSQRHLLNHYCSLIEGYIIHSLWCFRPIAEGNFTSNRPVCTNFNCITVALDLSAHWRKNIRMVFIGKILHKNLFIPFCIRQYI
jgi:hypothetical protein